MIKNTAVGQSPVKGRAQIAAKIGAICIGEPGAGASIVGNSALLDGS